MSTLVFGVDPNTLSLEFPSVPIMKASQVIIEVILFRDTMPTFLWKLMRWLRVGKENEMAEATEAVDRFIAQCVMQRKHSQRINQLEQERCTEVPEDLMRQYMNIEVPQFFQSEDRFLRDTMVAFFGAGKDTSGAALTWFFWLIAKNPEIEKKIFKELEKVQDSKRLSSCSDNEVAPVFDIKEVDGLVHLNAALFESMRLYPPFPLTHKVALKADVLPSGHKMKLGMNVIFCTYAMARMKEIWGEDCIEFKPERWITMDTKLKHEPSHKFMAFHSGPRLCLGKGFSLTQMKVVAAAIIYNYEIELVLDHVVEPKVSMVLYTKNGLMVKLKKRRI